MHGEYGIECASAEVARSGLLSLEAFEGEPGLGEVRQSGLGFGRYHCLDFTGIEDNHLFPPVEAFLWISTPAALLGRQERAKSGAIIPTMAAKLDGFEPQLVLVQVPAPAPDPPHLSAVASISRLRLWEIAKRST
jgi:hypothetical protein